MFDLRGLSVIPIAQARGQFFINYVTLCAYDAAYVMADDNFATVLESFVIASSL